MPAEIRLSASYIPPRFQPAQGAIGYSSIAPLDGRYVAGFNPATHTRPPPRMRCKNRSRPCG